MFTPSILTILGLILFRRLGYVVGGAGMARALLILLLANSISLLTTMSLSAIATNLRVKGGGDYYLISRSLGVEYGGALGIVLYLAQSISVAFYLLGFAEAMNELWPSVSVTIFAAGAMLVLFIFAWLGADWATRLQYLVMTALVAGLVSFAVGGIGRFSVETLHSNWTSPASGAPEFWMLFALFFPAVTGFTQGVSMSGDLEDPGRSLPVGTFAAVGVSIAVYGAAALIFAGASPAQELLQDYDSMARLAWLPVLITVGLVAATISSALASFLGAPRILQALAGDRVFPALALFARGYGPANNPRFGVLLTLLVALVFVGLGGVDFIAPIVSMFFLISYGLLNYATALEGRAASPSFRPRFRWFDYRASLVGAAGCLVLMMMISPWASAIAVAILFAIHQYIGRLSAPDRWADSRRDHQFQAVRANLHAMAHEPPHPRSWRPVILAFSDRPRRRRRLARFAEWLEGGAGLTTVVRVLIGEASKKTEERRAAERELEAELDGHGLEAFPLVIAAPDFQAAAETLVQAHGIGPLRANTVLLNWLDQRDASGGGESRATEGLYVQQLLAAHRLGLNAIVLDTSEERWSRLQTTPPRDRRIDVWWFRDDSTSRLALLLAHLLTRAKEWRDAGIRLLVASPGRPSKTKRERWEELLEDFRLDVELELQPRVKRERLIELSGDSTVVFLPLRYARRRAIDPFGKPIDKLLEELPVVALVSAAEEIALDAEPEEGEVGRLAELEDAARAARKQAERLEGKLEKAAARLAAAREDLEKAVAGGEEWEAARVRIGELEAEIERLRDEHQRAGELASRAEAARDEAAEKGAAPPREPPAGGESSG